MANERERWSLSKILVKSKPFIGVLSLQFGYAGMTIIAMIALNQGMNHFVMAHVYRNIVATVVMAPFALVLERKIRPKMTYTTFIKILALGLLEPVIDQNLYYGGMKYTSASFALVMYNITPVLTFLMAVILRLEKVELKKVHSMAKVVGTVITMGGAMVMTLFSGPVLEIVWFNGRGGETTQRETHDSGDVGKDWVKGSLMLIIGCFCWAGFIILQGLTLRDYPAGLSLSTLTCLAGAVEGTILTLAIERGNTAVWALGWDIKLLSWVYAGVVCSGIAYYVQGVVIKLRGPVFVTAFNPLSLVIVVILGSFCLAEKLYLGRVIGSTIIIPGLYFVVWGKSKDQIVSPQVTEDGSDSPAKLKIVDKAILIDFSNIDTEKSPATFSSSKATTLK